MNPWIEENSERLIQGEDGRTIFVFDWSKLSGDQKAFLIEYQLLSFCESLTSQGGKLMEILSNQIVPFAILNPEDELEPEELLDFDAQSDGVLLIQNGKILICKESTSTELENYTDSLEEVANEFSE